MQEPVIALGPDLVRSLSGRLHGIYELSIILHMTLSPLLSNKWLMLET